MDKVLQQQAVDATGGLGADPPASGGKRGFGGRALDAAALFTTFQKIRIFRHFSV